MLKQFVVFCLVLSFISLVISSDDATICKKVYFFVLDSGYVYNDTSLENLNSELNISNVEEYIDNYTERCYIPGYSDLLPKLPDEAIMNINSQENYSCSTSLSEIFNSYIPLSKFSLGTLKCKDLQTAKYIFSFSEDKGFFYLSGIRIWFVCFLAIMTIFFVHYIKNKKINKELNKDFSKYL